MDVCQYITRKSGMCGKKVVANGKCKLHCGSPEQKLCKHNGCDKWTISAIGYCAIHGNNIRAKDAYHSRQTTSINSDDIKLINSIIKGLAVGNSQ